MLRLNDFELHCPDTIEEAVGLLGERDGAYVVAGGTDLIPKMKRGQFEPSALVALDRIASLRVIDEDDRAVAIGAGTTLAALESWTGRDRLPALTHAVEGVATPIIRNMATIGGNLLQDTRCRYVDRTHFWREALGYCMKKGSETCRVAPGGSRCYASFCSDIAPALYVLDARVEITGVARREITVDELYTDDGIVHTKVNAELLSRVVVPLVPERRSRYEKLRMRQGFDFPEVGVGVSVMPVDGAIGVRAAVTGVGSAIVTAADTVERDAIADFVDRLYDKVKPMDTMFFAPAYRRKVARTLLVRAFDELIPPR